MQPSHWFISLLISIWPALTWAVPPIQHWQTDNGAGVYFIAAPQLPILDVRVVFRAGSARDDEQPGLARLTNRLLDDGAGAWDADTIATRFAQVGAQYSAGSARDMAWVTLRTMTASDAREQAVATFLEVLGAPNFPAQAIERLRRQTLVSLEEQAADPASLASKAFYRAIYGDHPYASPVTGTEEAVEAIEAADIRDFYARYYVAKNATIALVGDINQAQAEKLASRISAVLDPGMAAPPPPSVPPLNEAKTVRIGFPSQQAHIYIGQPGMRRQDTDYYPLYLGNHAFGGSGFTSRLVKEVRIKRGFAYSVYSYFSPMDVRGPFMIGLQTKVDQAEEAVAVAKEELAQFVENGPTPTELEASKANITGGFPLRIASNQSLVRYAAMIGFYDLPLSYLERYTSRIEAVTREQVTQALQRRLNPQRLVTVSVGGEAQATDR